MSRQIINAIVVTAFQLFLFTPNAHAVLNSEQGRWLRRDPLGTRDGTNRVQYVGGMPIAAVDTFGLRRHVFAFEGLVLSDVLPTSDSLDYNALEVYWKPIAIALDAEWHYFSQEDVDAAVDLAVQVATECVPTSECSCRRHTIVAAGYSMGGDSALEFANELDIRGIAVELGFTADPVPNSGMGILLEFITNHAGFHVPENTQRWVNWWQDVDTQTLGVGIHGKPINGAINLQLGAAAFTQHGYRWQTAHVYIPRLDWVRRLPTTNSFESELGAVPHWR